ncbi:MAG TPA: arylsulfatase [Candidatus Aminicenantes bacterium]|nr:arylsulfatase [Candidatus Aminicenantes bacterium]
MRSASLAALAAASPVFAPGCAKPARSARPNIVLIYADDLGYGDVGCYGADKVPTPAIDALAARGLRFTNAHSPAATCTPSRYALLTGEYAWRREGTGIAAGDANLIIEPGRRTLASMLRDAGYATGVVGKWHLGLGQGRIDWNGGIRPGPAEIGFDYSYLIPATGDRVPCVYVENGRVVGLDPADPIRVSFGEPVGDEPTGKSHPGLLRMRPSHGHDQTIVNGVSRIGYMSGGAAARWVDEDMADTITGKAVSFIERNAAGPFFLYFATHDIHVPRLPHPRFAGASGLGPRGDAIVEFDWSVGEIVRALDRLGLADKTLFVFTSDNGPVVDDGYEDQAVELLDGHAPSGPLRGGKYSAFDAGTRVPFVVRWPGKVEPGTSDALVSQVDFLASFAALTGRTLGAGEAPDSFDLSAALLGRDREGRDHLVEQAGTLSLIEGRWKYIAPSAGPATNANVAIELGNSPDPQLYDLETDIGETRNLASERPEIVERLAARLEAIRRAGRSRG